MPPQGTKDLVVDANVVRAAGESEHPSSVNCRSFLETLRDEDHRVVLSPDIEKEWEEHCKSEFSIDWWTEMELTDRVREISNSKNTDFRAKIRVFAVNAGLRNAMLKDVHLLEAASATDNIVASSDDKARGHFHRICHQISEIQNIIWVNPEKEGAPCNTWLKDGAPFLPKRCLQHYTPN